MGPDWLAALGPILAIGLALVFAPMMGWLFQGRKSGRSGVAGSFMDGFAEAFQPQQRCLQDAKREKKRGGRENGEPPSEE
jgi:hypothetical protein